MKNKLDYRFSHQSEDMIYSDIQKLFKQTYWAKQRTLEEIKISMLHSVVFGVFYGAQQIGFARVVTDHVTIYWLCDVIVDEKHRKKGLGKQLVAYVMDHADWQGLGILITDDAHTLYKCFGFENDSGHFMCKGC